MIVDPLHQCKPTIDPGLKKLVLCQVCLTWWASLAQEACERYYFVWKPISQKQAHKLIAAARREAVQAAGDDVTKRWS